VEDLLDLARVPKFTFRKTSVPALLRQTVETLDEELKMGSITCQLDIAADFPLIKADSDQLAKAFVNLTRNAIQSMPDGGQLSITASTAELPASNDDLKMDSPKEVVIAFEDSGSGIAPDDLKNIFNPFFTTRDKGTGLGLAITHKVISEHAGHIEVDSRQNNGSRFTVHLPMTI
jgi:two-component system sensor histidine kinase AtoS